MSGWHIELHDLPTWTANDRGHWSDRADAVKAWRMVTKSAANRHGVPRLGRVHVRLTMTPSDRRRRDPDNIAGVLKPVLDGLVDAGVLADDSAEYVASVTLVVERAEPGRGEHRWVVSLFEVGTNFRQVEDGAA